MDLCSILVPRSFDSGYADPQDDRCGGNLLNSSINWNLRVLLCKMYDNIYIRCMLLHLFYKIPQTLLKKVKIYL